MIHSFVLHKTLIKKNKYDNKYFPFLIPSEHPLPEESFSLSLQTSRHPLDRSHLLSPPSHKYTRGRIDQVWSVFKGECLRVKISNDVKTIAQLIQNLHEAL